MKLFGVWLIFCSLFFFYLPASTLTMTLEEQVENWRQNQEIPLGITKLKEHVQQFPQNQEAHNYLAEFLWAAGFLAEAEEQFQVVLQLNPNHGYAHIGLAHLLRERGENQKALAEFQIATKLFQGKDQGEFDNLILQQAKLLRDINQTDIAISLLKKSIPTVQNKESLLELYGELAMETGKILEFQETLTTWNQTSTNAVFLIHTIALERVLGKNTSPLIQQGLTRFPEDFFFQKERIRQQIGEKKFQSALGLINKLTGNKLDIQILLMEFHQARGDYQSLYQVAMSTWQELPSAKTVVSLLDASILSEQYSPVFTTIWRNFVTIAKGELPRILPYVDQILAQKRWDLAQKMINVVADLYPYESGWSQLQARMLLKQGKKKEALATCERATETETPALEIYLMMSELLTEETRTIENRLVLTRSMGLFPEEESRQRILQQCLRTGEYSLAQILYSQLRQTKEFALRRLFYDLAPGQLFAFLASYPNEIPVELLLTSAEVKQSIRQYAEAAKTFERVLQQDPVNRRALLGMGKLHLDKAEFDQAEAMFRKALSSGNVEAHEWLGKLDYLKGNFAKASQRILAGIKNSGPSAGLLQLAALLKLRQGDYQGVKKTVEQAFKSGIRLSGFILDQLNPEDFQQTAQMDGNFGDLDELVIRFRLGKILQDQGKIAAAKAEYQRVLAIQPQLNRIHFHLAECLLLEGKTVEALLKMRSSLDSALDLASAEERDLVLDSPYPCLTTILTGSAIISGDFPRAQELLLSQLEGFQKGTTDLVTDTDLMRGDVTFYPYFQQYFRINPPSVKCHELAKSLVILRNKGEITEESLKKLQIDSLVKEYLQVWLMMEKGQTKEAFIQLKKTLEADQLLEKLRLLMGVLFLFFH